MRRLIWSSFVRKLHKGPFRALRIKMYKPVGKSSVRQTLTITTTVKIGIRSHQRQNTHARTHAHTHTHTHKPCFSSPESWMREAAFYTANISILDFFFLERDPFPFRGLGALCRLSIIFWQGGQILWHPVCFPVLSFSEGSKASLTELSLLNVYEFPKVSLRCPNAYTYKYGIPSELNLRKRNLWHARPTKD